MGHEPHVHWRQIHLEDVNNLTLKAEGAGASVFKGTLPPSNPHEKAVTVAVRKPRITSSVALARFDTELKLRSNLSHRNLLELIAVCSSPPDYCTVSRWMSGGTLFDLVHTRNVNLSFERLLRLSLQFADAMAYLHRHNLVHRDLKTANILLDDRWENLVVADLDLLADVERLQSEAATNAGRALHRGPSNGRLSHMVGTLVYMAPEVLSGQPHTFAADVYAFAITVNEMAAAAVPFVDRKLPVPELHTVLENRFNELRLRSAIVRNCLRPVLATGISKEFRTLIEDCWHHEPDRRPTFEKIVERIRDMLSRGTDYLKTYVGSTLPSSVSNGHNDAEERAAQLLEEFRKAALDPPLPIWHKTQHGSEDGKKSNSDFPDITAGISSTCGYRGEDSMEDRSMIKHKLAGLPTSHLFAVFDGHAGHQCAEFAIQHLQGALFRSWANEESTPDSALIHAFEDIDYAFLNSTSDNEQSGSTATVALLIDDMLYVANAGDCRCVLGRRDGSAVALSKDHVATDDGERARIEARGGFVVTGRAQGCLMVSRAMGDRSVKRYITVSPDVVTRNLSGEDDFLILASDGLWDVVTNERAVELVRSTVRVPELAAKRLASYAMNSRSDDNISVIVAFLHGQVSYSNL